MAQLRNWHIASVIALQRYVRSWGYSRLSSRAPGLLSLTQLGHRPSRDKHRGNCLISHRGLTFQLARRIKETKLWALV
jgi:hypothetical protein